MPNQDFKITLRRDMATRMTCQEADCANYVEGWATVLDLSNAKHADAARFIKEESRRRFYEVRSDDAVEWAQHNAAGLGMNLNGLIPLLTRTPAGMQVFIFPPGQRCFMPHLDREVVFSHDRRIHVNPRDFNEDFNETVDKIATARRRG